MTSILTLYLLIQVIQMCCHGVTSTSCQQDETDSFHFSLPVSMETQNDDWDSPVQVTGAVSGWGHTLYWAGHQLQWAFAFQGCGSAPLIPASQSQQEVGRLMDARVDVDDRVYAFQLDSALARGGTRPEEEGFLALPIQDVLPAPAHIPASFWGKTWAQIELEDEEKVERLVRQFRRGHYVCYFDSESLAR